MRCAQCDEPCKKRKAILCRYCWRSVDDAPVIADKPVTKEVEREREK